MLLFVFILKEKNEIRKRKKDRLITIREKRVCSGGCWKDEQKKTTKMEKGK